MNLILPTSYNFNIFFADNMTTLDTICNQNSSPFRVWGGPSLFLIVHDAEDIETVLKSQHCLKRMYIYEFLRDSISDTVDGLFTSNGKDLSMKLIHLLV